MHLLLHFKDNGDSTSWRQQMSVSASSRHWITREIHPDSPALPYRCFTNRASVLFTSYCRRTLSPPTFFSQLLWWSSSNKESIHLYLAVFFKVVKILTLIFYCKRQQQVKLYIHIFFILANPAYRWFWISLIHTQAVFIPQKRFMNITIVYAPFVYSLLSSL